MCDKKITSFEFNKIYLFINYFEHVILTFVYKVCDLFILGIGINSWRYKSQILYK